MSKLENERIRKLANGEVFGDSEDIGKKRKERLR